MHSNLKTVLFVLACVGLARDVAAAEWALKGSLGQALQYNDNIALSTTDKAAVAGYLLTPSLEATRKTAAIDLGVTAQGNIRRYDDSSWDCDNYNLGSDNSYRTKRSVFSLTGGYSVSCSYTQQLKDTGLLVPSSQATSYRIAPAWTWQWTPRDQLMLNTSYSKTSYSNSVSSVDPSTGLIFSDNETYSVNLGGNHQWDKHLDLNGKLLFSNVQYSGSSASTQNLFGFQLGGNYKINRYWAVNASGGPMLVDSRQSSNSVTSGQNDSLSVGSVANINLSYDGQLSKFSTGYANSVSPSAIGQTLQSHSLFANYSYRLSRHVSFDLTGNYIHSESIGAQASNNLTGPFKRDYFTAAPSIVWVPAKNWEVRGSYVYRWQDYQQSSTLQNLNAGTTDSNAITISLGYSWDGIRISR